MPVAVNDAESVNEGAVLSASVAGNDTPSGDGGNVWSVVSTTTNGTLVFNADGSYTYTPNANYNGSDSFDYQVCDADGDCSTATVTITVICAQPSDAIVTVTQPTCFVSTGSISVTSPLGSGLTYSIDGTNFQSGTTFNGLSSGSYDVTVKNGACLSVPSLAVINSQPATPATPVVTVVNNCGSSVLSTTSGGALLWSNGATTASITVTVAGTYTVTSTQNGCTSQAGSGIASPTTIPATPFVTVVNYCGYSVLSTAASGSLLWSSGETTSSIMVASSGTYYVTATINGCTSLAGSGIAAPNAFPSAPVVTAVNNCGTSILSTTASGSLLWSNGATTS